MGVILFLLYACFVLACIFLIIIILLQEGKGGGFGEVFGGMASETFGVKASGITKVTAALAAVFVGSAILISILQDKTSSLAATGGDPTEVESILVPGENGDSLPAESGTDPDKDGDGE